MGNPIEAKRKNLIWAANAAFLLETIGLSLIELREKWKVWRKKLMWAVKTAFSFGNKWAFDHRTRIRVKGLCLKEQDRDLKEQDLKSKEQGHPYRVQD